jgi:hypothetical protein
LQWAEWESGSLTAKDQILASSEAPLHLGLTSSAGEWPNPIVSWTIAGAPVQDDYVNFAATQPYEDFEPTMMGFAGSPGLVQYWPSAPGVGLTTAASTMDFL